MEYKYDSRKNCASQMKRKHNFFSVSHFATTLLTVNCQLSTVNWIHTFSAKERDTETGYSYFGARYYSSDLSIWLSVDPMSDKYPSLSPYVYCANNPIKLVDPNGEEILSPYVYCANNPIKLVDPNGEEIGDYYNWKGKYLGWDGHNDDKIYFVHGKKDERILKKANGSPVHPDEVNIDVTTSKQAVREILYVADMTSYNGELWEEASYLTTKGRYTDGGPNINCLLENEDPYVDVNYEGEIIVSVHSHLPYLTIKNSDEIKSYSALRPSTADKLIKSTQNIITGPLGDTEWISFANGKSGFWSTPERGAAFYDENWNYQGDITISNLRKINIW